MKAKTKLNRLLSMLIALAMLLGMLPAMSLTALAEGKIPITEFSGSISLPAPVYGERLHQLCYQ